ncbi:MAG: prepilin-type N-terminal cleavage/methylation domain-containing protein [Candidatus Paceibacterota bacterium]
MILQKIQKNKVFMSGFTLIELMVATTLFTIVMMMGVGSLVVSSNSAKASQKLRTAVDNVNFAMESMSRELRMGTLYTCGTTTISLSGALAPNDCSSTPGNIIAFKPQSIPGGGESVRVAYEIGSLRADGVTRGLVRCEYTTTTVCSNVVSSDVDIQMLKFYVVGSALPPANNQIQPSVKILVKGVVTIKGVATPFTLQTLASQRSTEK